MAETLTSLADLKGSAAGPVVAEAPVHVQKLDKQGRAYATGKRKNAVARVWIKPGRGLATVNGKPLDAYFARPVLRMILSQPLVVVNRITQYDLMVTVTGGGLSGQAGAVRHGIAKALTYFEPELRARAQEGRLPDPRLARGRAQEVRPQEGPRELPVLEALTRAVLRPPTRGRGSGGRLYCRRSLRAALTMTAVWRRQPSMIACSPIRKRRR